MNLQQKIVAIRKEIDVFVKDKESFGYSYVSGAQVFKKIKSKMDELNVLLIPKVTTQHHSTHTYTNSKGKTIVDFIVWGDMVYEWQNADEPEQVIEIPWKYFGQQEDFSKAFGSALTYSERYFLLKSMNVPTDEDDPDTKQNTEYKKRDVPVMPTNAKESGDIVLSFGKHKGKQLREIYKEDKNYFDWLSNSEKTQPDIKEAIRLMNEAVRLKEEAEANQSA